MCVLGASWRAVHQSQSVAIRCRSLQCGGVGLRSLGMHCVLVLDRARVLKQLAIEIQKTYVVYGDITEPNSSELAPKYSPFRAVDRAVLQIKFPGPASKMLEEMESIFLSS